MYRYTYKGAYTHLVPPEDVTVPDDAHMTTQVNTKIVLQKVEVLKPTKVHIHQWTLGRK